MKRFDEWYFPDHEEHLQEWMGTVGDRQHGRLIYQGNKYRTALKYTKQRRRAVDVGGHVGLWSFQMVHDFDRVDAFEPMPAHRECWTKNIGEVFDPKLCEVHPYALGADDRGVHMSTRTPNSSGDTSVDLDGNGLLVQQVRLDWFGFRDIDFLKIDCEGYELYVCQGARATLLACKPVVIVEQKPETGGPDRYGISTTAAVEYLEALGAKRREVLQGDYILSWD